MARRLFAALLISGLLSGLVATDVTHSARVSGPRVAPMRIAGPVQCCTL